MSRAGVRAAGRELDALIAEKVMGLEWRDFKMYCRGEGWYPKNASQCNPRNERDHLVNPVEYRSELPWYSGDIAAAWEVVEKLNARGEWVTVGLNAAHRAQCFISTSGERENVDAEADTAPLAICLAALRAVGAEPPEGAER